MGVRISKKYGVNPSVTRCVCCGNSYGVALFGTSWKDDKGRTAEAPMEVFQGLCDDCGKVVRSGGVMIIEVRDGETGSNPYRTGRIVGLSKDFRERNHLEGSMMYMPQSEFTKAFGDVEFSK